LCWVFLRWSLEHPPRLTSNLDPPNLCLLGSQYYRREPLVPGSACGTLRQFYDTVFPQFIRFNALLI
jgi:hypothetical protein